MMRWSVLLIAAALWADSRNAQRKIEEKRVAEYHRLNAKNKQASADLRVFIEQWGRECQSRGQDLKLDATGDPACENKPPEAKK